MRNDESRLLAGWKDPFRYLLEMLVIIFLCLPCWKLMWVVVIDVGFGQAACSACAEFCLPLSKGCWAKRFLPWVPALWWGVEFCRSWFSPAGSLWMRDLLMVKCESQSTLLPLAALSLGRHEQNSRSGTESFCCHFSFGWHPVSELISSFQCILGQFASRVGPGSWSRANWAAPPCTPPLLDRPQETWLKELLLKPDLALKLCDCLLMAWRNCKCCLGGTCECFQHYFSVLDLRAERHETNLNWWVIVFILVLQVLFEVKQSFREVPILVVSWT